MLIIIKCTMHKKYGCLIFDVKSRVVAKTCEVTFYLWDFLILCFKYPCAKSKTKDLTGSAMRNRLKIPKKFPKKMHISKHISHHSVELLRLQYFYPKRTIVSTRISSATHTGCLPHRISISQEDAAKKIHFLIDFLELF